MIRFFRQPIDDVLGALEHLVTVRNPLTTMVPAMISMIVTWLVYVGIHELLHVAGCLVAGGSVSQLEISSRYGGAIYARYFDFVVTNSEYAGRLSGFDTHGSDLIYMSTVFGPFLLTVLFGVLLVKLCARRRRPLLFGLAVIVGLAPFYNLQGDYFEMGSILVTRAITTVFGGGNPPMFELLRSDDIFKLFATFIRSPSELGLTSTGQVIGGVFMIIFSFVVDVLLAFATYWAGHQFARLFLRSKSTA